MSSRSMESDAPPLPGDRVGGYLLGDVLGVGGMATVYSATAPDGERVAVKVLHPGRTDQDEARRFRREFLTLRALRHPSVVQVFEAGRAGVYPWIAMEYIAGTDLESLIERWSHNPPPQRMALVSQIFRDLCGAIAYVHSQGLIHRDLKPSNVLVTPDHRAKLTDFGVVKAPFGQFHTQLTAVGSLVGTAAYMSPEQISGDAVDGRSDLYSLGAVLYVMLTGRRPIVADSVAGYLTRHLTELPQDPRELDPRIPPALSSICMRLLTKDPAQRYATAEQVLLALDAGPEQGKTTIHGRDAEVGALLLRLQRLRSGAGGLMLLVGPSGSGRSVLLSACVDRARENGWGVSFGDGAKEGVLDVLASQIPALGPSGQDTNVVRRIALLTHGRPWTLAIDDLDLAPPQVLDAITGLLRQQVAVEGEPLLIVGTAQGTGGTLAGLGSGAATGLATETIALAPMSNAAVRALLRERGVGGAACTALSARLVADGVVWPADVLEQLDALERGGWLHRDAHGALAATRDVDLFRQGELPLPMRLRRQEEESLARLDTPERTFLDTLVVLGGEADPATIAEIHEIEGHHVERSALRLIRLGFVREQAAGSHGFYQLTDTHSRSLLYELIDEAPRADLHRRVAAVLQRQRGRPAVADIAGHLLRAGQPEAAWPLLLKGASVAMRAGRSLESRALLDDAERAASLATGNLAEETVWALKRQAATIDAELRERGADPTAAREAWERAAVAARHEQNPAAELRARAGACVLRVVEGEAADAFPELAGIWKRMAKGDPLWGRVSAALAESLLARGRIDDSRKLWTAIGGFGKRVQSDAWMAVSRLGLATVSLACEPPTTARAHLAEAESDLRAIGDRIGLARCLVLQADLSLAAGELRLARELADEARRISDLQPSVGCMAGAVSALADNALGGTIGPSVVSGLLGLGRDQSRTVGAGIEARTAIARVCAIVGQDAQAREMLVDLDPTRPVGLTDPVGQLQAVRARVVEDLDEAAADAWSAMGREVPLFPVAAARIALDAAHGLARVDAVGAEDAIAEALDRTSKPGLELLRLEAVVLGCRLGIMRTEDACALRDELAGRIKGDAAFRARWTLG